MTEESMDHLHAAKAVNVAETETDIADDPPLSLHTRGIDESLATETNVKEKKDSCTIVATNMNSVGVKTISAREDGNISEDPIITHIQPKDAEENNVKDLIAAPGPFAVAKAVTNTGATLNEAKQCTANSSDLINSIRSQESEQPIQETAQTENTFPEPGCTRLLMFEDDIELDHFASPLAGTDSTDQLVPLSNEGCGITDAGPTEQTSSFHSVSDSEVSQEDPVPNYKPFPLRWPFQVLILAVIAGMFSFLEFKVRDLPPERYAALPVNPSGYSNNLNILTTAPGFANPKSTSFPTSLHTTNSGPMLRSPILAATATRSQPSLMTLSNRSKPTRTRAPKLMIPDPRLDSSMYPNPDARVTTFCAWGSISWEFYQLSPPHWTHPDDHYVRRLRETIPVFMTTDPSWCRCTVYRGIESRWDIDMDRLGVGGLVAWETNDKGCESAMNAISSFNQLKILAWSLTDARQTTMYNWWSILSQPPTGPTNQPFWVFPTTNAGGDFVFPLEVRVRTKPSRDVFGNQVKSTDSAAYPARFCCLSGTPLGWEDPVASGACAVTFTPDFPWYLDSPVYGNPEFWITMFDCPASSIPYKTIWWTLPKGRPSTAPNQTEIIRSTPTDISTSETETQRASMVESALWTSQAIPLSSHRIGSATQPDKTTNTGDPTPQSSHGDMSQNLTSKSVTTVRHNGDKEGLQGEESSLLPASGKVTSLENTSYSPRVSRSRPLGLPTVTNSASPWISDAPAQEGFNGAPSNSAGEAISPEVPVTASLLTTEASANRKSPETVTILYVTSGTPVKTVLTLPSRFTTSTRGNNSAGATGPPTINLESIDISYISEEPVPTTSPIPSPPLQGPIPPDVQGAFFNLRSEADYLMASLIPVLLATVVGIPIQIFVTSVNSHLPFRALRNGHGSPVSNSLLLPQRTWLAPLVALQFLRRVRDPLPLFSILLNTLATLLIPLSTETIRLEFTSMDCKTFTGMCAYGLRRADAPIRAAEALLAAMAALVAAMGFILVRSQTGVPAEPWSTATIASLLLSPEVRELVRSIPTCSQGESLSENQTKDTFGQRLFRLGHSTSTRIPKARPKYAIQVLPTADDKVPIQATVRDPPNRKPKQSTRPEKRFWQLEPPVKELSIRLLALILVTGLLILILYYENTVLDTPFESFMDSQSFGVRLLFTGFGSAVSSFWDYYFFEIANPYIHYRLSLAPQTARSSILTSPPSNVFTGLWYFLSCKDVFAFNLAFATLLAKFTPILLSNVPFRNTVTWKMHETCTWMAVAVLGYMVLLPGASLLIEVLPISNEKRRHRTRPNGMPIKPDTLVGCMYYLVHSKMLEDFEGLSVMRKKERDTLVSEMGKLYTFGKVTEGVRGASDHESSRREGLCVDYFVPANTA